MAHPYHHALSSVKRWGGKPEDYLPIHDFFDSSKELYANWRHRALYHHAHGIFLAEKIFGHTVKNCDGKQIPTRLIAEQHVMEDLGFIPTMQDWFKNLNHEKWMTKGVQKLDLEEVKE